MTAQAILKYFSSLNAPRVVLWCYLIWYAVMSGLYFDPSPKLWLNAAGISLVVGIALVLCVHRGEPSKQNTWQTFRLFLVPFCVSSFSALIKDRGFVLIFPPGKGEVLLGAGSCMAFVALTFFLKNQTR